MAVSTAGGIPDVMKYKMKRSGAVLLCAVDDARGCLYVEYFCTSGTMCGGG